MIHEKSKPYRPPPFRAMLPPGEARQLERYIDSRCFTAGLIASEMARRVLQPDLIVALRKLKDEHQAAVRQLAGDEFNHREIGM